MIEFLKTSDEQRLKILNLLSERRLCVFVIEDVLKLKQSTISTYLAKLKRLNLINSEKSSKWIYYYKNIEPSLHSILQSVIINFKRADIAKRDIDSLKHIDNFLDKKFDIAIFICKEAYNTHRDKIKADKTLFWDIEDIDFENIPFEKFNKVYNEIIERMKKEV